MAMKEFTLTISERVEAAKLFDEFKGGVSALSQILEDVKGVVIPNEEWEKAKLVKKPNADGTENWSWTDEGTEKVLSLSQESIDYLKSQIKAKDEAGALTIRDKAVVSLQGKLSA